MFESFRNHSSVFLLSSLLALGLLHGFFAGRAGENAVLPVVFLAALVAATAEAAPSRKLTLIAGGLAGLTFSTVVAVRWLHIEAASAMDCPFDFLSIFGLPPASESTEAGFRQPREAV